MSDWITVSLADLTPDPPRTNRGHSFDKMRGISWPSYCKCCGLVLLKNPISQLCVRIGCDYALDPRVKQWYRTHRL